MTFCKEMEDNVRHMLEVGKCMQLVSNCINYPRAVKHEKTTTLRLNIIKGIIPGLGTPFITAPGKIFSPVALAWPGKGHRLKLDARTA